MIWGYHYFWKHPNEQSSLKDVTSSLQIIHPLGPRDCCKDPSFRWFPCRTWKWWSPRSKSVYIVHTIKQMYILYMMYIGYNMPEYVCMCIWMCIYIYIPTNNNMLNQCIYSVVGFWKNKTMKHTNNLDETDWEKALQVFIASPSEKMRGQVQMTNSHSFGRSICQVGNSWLTRMLILAPKIKAGSITLPMISALLTYSTHCYGASLSWSDGKLIALLSKSTSCHRKTREDTSTLKSTLSYSGN